MEENKYIESTVTAAVNGIFPILQNLVGAPQEEKKCYMRRWVWELIQNANDASSGNLNIKINVSENVLTFAHTGIPFDYDSLFSLITQISEKADSENDSIGRFGTGFITTCLLNRDIDISGIYKTKDGRYVNFDFKLCRSGSDRSQLRKQIIRNLECLEKLETLTTNAKFDISNYNTIFTYRINRDNISLHSALENGRNDLFNQVAFVLAFSDKINSIQYNSFKWTKDVTKQNKFLITIREVNLENLQVKTIQLLVFSKENVQIALLANEVGNTFEIKPYSENTSLLFCQFPLIGSEYYSLPIVVNSKDFIVNDPRSSILENDFNKKIINQAIVLYDEALDYLIRKKASCFYNVCKLPTKMQGKYHEEIRADIRNVYERKPIVRLRNDEYVCLKLGDKPNIIVPKMPENKELYEDKLWNILNYYNNINLVHKNEYKLWSCIFEKSHKQLDDIIFGIKGSPKLYLNCMEFMNDFYRLLIDSEEINNFYLEDIFINQVDSFTSLNELYFDKNISLELREIYNLLLSSKKPIKSLEEGLLNKKILVFDEENIQKKYKLRIKDDTKVLKDIASEVNHQFSLESNGSYVRDEKIISAFKKLYIWITSNEKFSLEIIPGIYSDRMRLYPREEQVQKLELAEETERLFKEENVSNLNELRQKYVSLNSNEYILQSSMNIDEFLLKKNPCESDIIQFISTTGIVNQELFQKVLGATSKTAEEKKEILKYKSSGTQKAFDWIMKKIEQANTNIFAHLNGLNGYEIPQFPRDDLKVSDTVFDGIYKDGKEIKLIIRPCIGDKIIIYYQTELDFLEYPNYELWVWDDNNGAKQLTLGSILKYTGIRNIPLYYLYGDDN